MKTFESLNLLEPCLARLKTFWSLPCVEAFTGLPRMRPTR